MGVEYDSGDYERSLAEAMRLSDYDKLIRERDAARTRGELVGVGVSTFVIDGLTGRGPQGSPHFQRMHLHG